MAVHNVCKWSILIIVLITFVQESSSQSMAKLGQLYTDLMTNYNLEIRPVANQSDTVMVDIYLSIVSIQEFDEVLGKFSAVAFLNVLWTDPRFVWNPALYEGISSIIFQPDNIWIPRMALANSHGKINTLTDVSTIVRCYPNGLCVWLPGDIMKSTCTADVKYFPFDKQTCKLSFIGWGYSGTEILLSSPASTVNTDLYAENGEWDLAETSTNCYVANTFPFCDFTITMERIPTIFIVNVILPIIFLGGLNIMVFVLPSESGERVSYSITVLLSIALFMTLIGDSMPKTSKPMSLMAYFMLTNLALSTLMCVSVILILKVVHPMPLLSYILIHSNSSCLTMPGHVPPADVIS